jgi:hypothetical protein
LKGQLVTYTGLGSGIGAKYFSIDLDRDNPVADYVNAKGKVRRRQPFPLRITDSDQEVFDVTAGISRRDCEWRLLSWTGRPEPGRALPSSTTTASRSGPPVAAWPTHPFPGSRA